MLSYNNVDGWKRFAVLVLVLFANFDKNSRYHCRSAFHAPFILEICYLKGHSYKNVCEIITLNYRLGLNKGPRWYFNFFKSPLKRFFKLLILLNKMGSLDLQNIAVFRSKMCTDTPLIPARLCPPICLIVPARHPQCACQRRRTGPPSIAPYCHAILSSARVSGSPRKSTRHTEWRPRKGFLARSAVWLLQYLRDN
jgi:hypothetical protein